MLQTSTLKFLNQLKKNNNKPWFEANRKAYESAKQDFESFIASILSALGKTDEMIADLKAKECMFRINRDVRFSKDKSPYKTNMGASIKRGGKKSIFAGYYFHLEPGKSFAGGGMWMPDPVTTKKIRQEISYCHDEFKSIISTRKFKSVYGDLDKDKEFSLINLPKGYEQDDPAGDYLRLKSWIATNEITDAEITSKGLTKKVVDSFLTLQPLLNFINRSLED
jgi:uncharacterized protein (TIGR02453 family)